MEEYLVDRETLGKFVDELIKKKALNVNDTGELNQLREDAIKKLDDKIIAAVFGRLSDEQLGELNLMLDDDARTEDDYQKFFADAGVSIEDVMVEAMNEFGNDFLGGDENE